MATKSGAECYEFTMGFISSSDKLKSQYVDRWEEVLCNFVVEPEGGAMGYDRSPYRYGKTYKPSKRQVVLKDPETHKLCMTYLAKIMRTLFSDARREYVKAEPVGWEDAPQKAPTATKLLRYAFGLPGTYRSFQESSLEMLLVGTSILEVGYRYEERPVTARSVSVNDYGDEETSSDYLMLPVYDDVEIRPIAVTDFYPDPGRARIQDMCGAAKRFRMTGYDALRMAQKGIYDMAAVKAAMAGKADQTPSNIGNYRIGYDLPGEEVTVSAFREMVGYEYFGAVPYERGERWMVITILNGEVVREKPYAYADPCLPFYPLVINPVVGRFYGISPAEVVRFDQSFADALKMLLAEAVIRMVHPPIAFDPDSDLDVAALKAWKSDAVIAARGGPNAIGTVRYNADLPGGFSMMQGIKSSIQESSGARPGIQGDPGPDREAATAAAYRVNAAMDQPELVARLLEEDCLPPIGKAILRRYQQFLGDTEDLKRRVGELPESVWIGDIMGDFDVSFSGSRTARTLQQKLQSLDRLTAMAAANPAFQAMLPTAELAKWIVGDVLELQEVAAEVGNPDAIRANLAMQMMMGKGAQLGNGNGVPPTAEPAGILPAQAVGSAAE